MKHIFSLLVFFSAYGLCFGQHGGASTCELQTYNKAWILKFKNAPNKAEKVQLVVSKMLADTDYFKEHPVKSDEGASGISDQELCSISCSIRFGLLYSESKGLTLDLIKNPSFEELILEFNDENIGRIELNEYRDRDIYNANGVKRTGIILYTDNNELQKSIKKTLKAL